MECSYYKKWQKMHWIFRKTTDKQTSHNADTLYWNYDLGKTVEKTISKCVFHETSDTITR